MFICSNQIACQFNLWYYYFSLGICFQDRQIIGAQLAIEIVQIHKKYYLAQRTVLIKFDIFHSWDEK